MKREMHLGDPCVFCDGNWDQIAPGPCPGRPGLEATADTQLTIDALQDRYLRLHEVNAELLVACEAALDWMTIGLDRFDGEPRGPVKNQLCAAIAKAKGEDGP